MKKTLFTLAAIAGASSELAVADTVWTDLDTIGTTFVQDWGGGSVNTLNAYTFQFTIPEGALTSGSTVLAYINGNLPGTVESDKNRQFTYVLSAGSTEGKYTLEMGRSNLTADASSIVWNTNKQSVENALVENVVYTVTSSGGNNPEIVVSFPGAATNKYTRPATDTGQLVFDSNNLVPTAKLNAAFAIPEPATATLSLLALAGLCARRRRN